MKSEPYFLRALFDHAERAVADVQAAEGEANRTRARASAAERDFRMAGEHLARLRDAITVVLDGRAVARFDESSKRVVVRMVGDNDRPKSWGTATEVVLPEAPEGEKLSMRTPS